MLFRSVFVFIYLYPYGAGKARNVRLSAVEHCFQKTERVADVDIFLQLYIIIKEFFIFLELFVSYFAKYFINFELFFIFSG